MDFSFSDLNFNSVETLPGYEARAAFTVNSASVFKEDVDIVPTIVDDTLSYIPWGGDSDQSVGKANVLSCLRLTKSSSEFSTHFFSGSLAYTPNIR